jgi:3-oxoacyl-[acyl-carrier protein] reductase
MTDFTDDVAVVTGGTKGIGRAVAERLASHGATTVATYAHDEEAAAATERQLQSHASESEVRKCDVREYAAVAETFDAVADDLGSPSILVNNAGVMANSLLVRMSPEEWGRVLDTNLTGSFYCLREAARHMLRGGGGRVVNVSSIAAKRGWAGQANYAASKAGIIGLTRSAARELGDRSIRVNAVCPGYTDTEMYHRELDDASDSLVEMIPEGRIADPEEIADAIQFLLGDDASYVNGEVLRVDGGLLS